MGPIVTACLLAFVMSCDLLNGVDATTCTTTTGNTCPTTLFSTGTCGADGNCTCTAGYSPETRGCRKDLTVPAIELSDSNNLPFGTDGANFTMLCNPNVVGTYVWRHNGTVVGMATGPSLMVTPARSGSPHQYTCQYSQFDQTSAESAVFVITIVLLSEIDSTDPAIASSIQGIPTTIVNQTILTLTCAPAMVANVTFLWFHPFTSPIITDNTLIAEINTVNHNTDVMCDVQYTENAVMKNVSTSVSIPTISDNIPGVLIAEGDRFVLTGGSMSLTCAFDEDDFVSVGIPITWQWFFNETLNSTYTTQTITVNPVGGADHGEWRCTAQYQDQTPQNSSSIFVYVDYDFSVSITSTPSIPITNGHLELKCVVNSSLTLNFTYFWVVGADVLINYEDDTLYFNDINNSVADTYRCSSTIDQKSVIGALSINTPVLFSESTAPILDVNNSLFEFGQTYEFTCFVDEDYSTPGFQISFLANDVQIAIGDVTTHVIEGSVDDRNITCLTTFNGLTSDESNVILASFPVFDNVQINDVDNNVITSIDAVVNTVIILQCAVSLLPNVPGTASVTWNEVTMAFGQVGMETTLELEVTQDVDLAYRCTAVLGSHSMTADVTVVAHALSMPQLSIVDGMTTTNLDFLVLHQLHCDAGNITTLFDIRYTFLKDGIEDLTNSGSDTYNVTNDVFDREYTCQALYLTAISTESNPVILSFAVFDTLEIQDTNGNTLDTLDAIVNTSVSLVSSVGLLPGVPGQASITWFDDDGTDLGTDTTLVVNIAEESNKIYYFNADLGNHTMRSPDVTVIGNGLEAPVLSLMNNPGGSLNFSETYFLHCDAYPDFSPLVLQYGYLRDNTLVHTGINDTYAISNDVINREYTCHVSYQTVTSPISNSINTTFDVFDAIDITESVRCHVRSDVNPMFLATLTCNVSLLPGVPDLINYTWYDVNNADVGSESTFSIFLTDDVNTTMTCQADVGSHVETVTSTYEVFIANLTRSVPCSAASAHMSLLLLVLALSVTFCHNMH